MRKYRVKNFIDTLPFKAGITSILCKFLTNDMCIGFCFHYNRTFFPSHYSLSKCACKKENSCSKYTMSIFKVNSFSYRNKEMTAETLSHRLHGSIDSNILCREQWYLQRVCVCLLGGGTRRWSKDTRHNIHISPRLMLFKDKKKSIKQEDISLYIFYFRPLEDLYLTLQLLQKRCKAQARGASYFSSFAPKVKVVDDLQASFMVWIGMNKGINHFLMFIVNQIQIQSLDLGNVLLSCVKPLVVPVMIYRYILLHSRTHSGQIWLNLPYVL